MLRDDRDQIRRLDDLKGIGGLQSSCRSVRQALVGGRVRLVDRRLGGVDQRDIRRHGALQLLQVGSGGASEVDQRCLGRSRWVFSIHSDAGEAKTGPPAEIIGKQRAEQLAQNRSQVDAHIEDGEAGVAPPIALLVQRADDRRNVRLEETVADGDQRQSDEHDRQCQRIAVRPGNQGTLRQVLHLLPIVEQRD